MSLLSHKKTERYVGLLLIVALCASLSFGVSFSKPKKAEAFFGCGVEAEVISQSSKALKAASAVAVPINNPYLEFHADLVSKSSKKVSDRKCYLDAIVKGIAKAIIHELVSSIIDWINRGFEGGPTFVTNPARFFGNIADEEIGRVIDGSELGWVCDPFKLQLQLSFLQQRSRYRAPSRCSITGIVQNFQSFVGGDFSQGGWQGWLEITTKPENNPYGSFLITEQNLQLKIAGRQDIAGTQLNWGKGFKSLLNLDGEIKTPGALIQDTLSDATGQDLKDLNLAREFDDIVIALVNLGINRIMSGGLGGN